MRVLIAAAAFAALCPAQDWTAQVRALRPANTSSEQEALLDEVQERAHQALDSLPRARTQAEADAARPGLRRRLLDSLGVDRLPWPPDLQTRHVGTLTRSGYRIEKLVYQGLPGVQIPAHLYIPEGLTGRAPAILFYPGHWWPDAKTRPDFQAFCINMARLGFVVLAWDPFGQGERGMSGRDHRRIESLLVGVAQQGIAEYETRCALEYLLGRPEVDSRRIGLTGASGGGFNTWITSSIDDRIAVAVPVVGTSDFYEQVSVLRPLDWYHTDEHCHFVPGLMRYANNHELLAMAAPRPVLIVAASEDQAFPVTGVRRVYEYGRELYRSYGQAEKIGLFVDSSTSHGYQQKKREAAYGWFLKWLMGKGDGSPYPEPETSVPAFDDPQLRCFPPGRNQSSGAALVAAMARLATDAGKKDWPSLEERACPVEVKETPLQRLSFCGMPAFFLQPSGRRLGVLVALDDRGKEALPEDSAIRQALAAGWAICGVDPSGIGERATDKMDWIAAVSLLLGDYFVARQAGEVRSALRAFAAEPVALYARGPNSGLIAAQVLNRTAVKWHIVREGFASYRSFLVRPKSLAPSYELRTSEEARRAPYDHEIPLFYVPFHALQRRDIPELLSGSPGLMVSPINGDWEMAPESDGEVAHFIQEHSLVNQPPTPAPPRLR